jgi:diguanylate cyclase (GGDEF)-like protein
MLPLLFGGLVLVVWYAIQGNIEARTILVGWTIFLYASINDILLSQGLVQTPRLLTVGFAAVLISMAISLANRFTRIHNHLDSLVRERTQALEQSNEKLVRAARMDTLTGLLNRRGFVEIAEAEVARAHRSWRSFVILLADVDRFKSINDRYGHGCGDFALRRVGELLREQLRDVDTVARWGGEEFIFLLPETSLEGGWTLAEKLRTVLARTPLVYEDKILNLTITIGVAAFTRDMDGYEQCISIADDALYRGKQGGRNRVVVADRTDGGATPAGAVNLPDGIN